MARAFGSLCDEDGIDAGFDRAIELAMPVRPKPKRRRKKQPAPTHRPAERVAHDECAPGCVVGVEHGSCVVPVISPVAGLTDCQEIAHILGEPDPHDGADWCIHCVHVESLRNELACLTPGEDDRQIAPIKAELARRGVSK